MFKNNFVVITLAMLMAIMSGDQGQATEVQAGYFRMWEGFKKSGLSTPGFYGEIPQFMKDTVDLYGGAGVLSNYIVVMPPLEKPSFIPDELALVGLTSEVEYRAIRQTSPGQRYSDRHWDVFERSVSKSAPGPVDYWVQQPTQLDDATAYDVIGFPIDWSTGVTYVYIGLRRPELSQQAFLAGLAQHVGEAARVMWPQGLRGYLVIAHGDYEVAYMNWMSVEAHDRASRNPRSQTVFAGAQSLMTPLMYQAANPIQPGAPIAPGGVYSTMSR